MKKNIINIIKTITILVALFCNIENINKFDFKNMFNVELFTLSIMMIIIYQIIKKDNTKSNISIRLLSVLFSIFFVFGNSYKLQNSWKLIFSNIISVVFSIIIFMGYYYLFSYILKHIYNFLDSYKINNKNKKKDCKIKIFNKFKKIKKLFYEHPFIFSLCTILIGWLIYIIAFYPAILSPDPSFQIKQFFGIYTKYMDYIIPIDKSVTITNHHPVIHTILLGGCVKLGSLINNTNLGFFLYSIIQILILSTTLAFTIKYMIKINTPKKIVIASLIIYALTPVYGLYSMSAVKDVIFTSLIILFNIFIFDITINKNKLKLKQIIIFIMLMILIVLFRNNGIYVIILTLLYLLIVEENRRKLGVVLIAIMILFNYSYNNIMLPHFKISAGSVREALSIPFQQSARYVKYNYSSLDKDEYDAIDKVLNIETLASRYKPEISDPVKNEFNKNYTSEDLKNYFKAWFKGLTKKPETYIEATLNNIYGYFYPNKTRWYVYYNYYNILNTDGIDYHYNNLGFLRKILSNFAISFPYIPILGMIVNIGFNTLILLFMITYLIYKKRNITFLIPSFVSLLVCIASPVNAYFRYAMPYIFSMPLLISMFLYNKDK